MIHLTQCLCARSHAIVGIVWEEPKYTPDSAIAVLRQIVSELVDTGRINPWCGVCFNQDFHYADTVTSFRSIEDILPELHRIQASNNAARRLLLGERGIDLG